MSDGYQQVTRLVEALEPEEQDLLRRRLNEILNARRPLPAASDTAPAMRDIELLDLEARQELIEWIVRSLINAPRRYKPSIMKLKGVGKGLWEGIDAQEYVNQERDSWER